MPVLIIFCCDRVAAWLRTNSLNRSPITYPNSNIRKSTEESFAAMGQSHVDLRFWRRKRSSYIECVDWAVIPPAMAHVVPEMATSSERIRRKLADLSQTASRGMDAANVEGTFPLLTMSN